MILRFLLLFLVVTNLYSMQNDLRSMSDQEYRAWFAKAKDQEIHEKVVKAFFNRPMISADQYDALLVRKGPEWAAQKALRLQQAKHERLKNCGAVVLALLGWACIATYLFHERITEFAGSCLQL